MVLCRYACKFHAQQSTYSFTSGSRSGGRLLTALAVAILACACGGASPFAAEDDLRAIVLTPDHAELAPGEKIQFQVQAYTSGGLKKAPVKRWEATGGTITQDGLYTAGKAAGNYEVRAVKGRGVITAPVKIVSGSSGTDGDSESPPPPDEPDQDGAVRVAPGQSIQASVDANPAGTAFKILQGRHVKQTIRPKDGMSFIGEAGAVLDGAGVTEHAFLGGTTSSVTIRGLIIENYAPPLRTGAIQAPDTDRWVIEDTEVRYSIADYSSPYCVSAGCGGMGIRIGDRMIVRNSSVHHNDQYGMGGSGDNVLIEGTEIAYNHYRNRVTGSLKGGTKFVKTTGLVLRGNHVHHNNGPGFWTDIDNRGVLIEKNVIEDNRSAGIFHEISYSAVIRNNQVRRNAVNSSIGGVREAGIMIGHSSDVEIYGNLVEGNHNGIGAIQQDRGTHYLKNLWVHDNVVRDSGLSGVMKGGGASFDPFTDAANNRFDHNDYVVPGSMTTPFRWDGSSLAWEGWRKQGHDLSGTLTTR